jgi:TPP-dependent 2-oxoacid decarboxylase
VANHQLKTRISERVIDRILERANEDQRPGYCSLPEAQVRPRRDDDTAWAIHDALAVEQHQFVVLGVKP